MTIMLHFPSMIIGAVLMIPILMIGFLIWGIQMKKEKEKDDS